MTKIIKIVIIIVIGLGTGFTISAGVFAFIGMIGLVPRMAIKTRTSRFAMLYEEVIIFGGLFGSLSTFIDYNFSFNMYFFIPYWLCLGVFTGCLAVSLAEVMDVLPIVARRIRLRKGLIIFVLCMAIGKVVGSLLYFFVPGFKLYF